MALHRSHTTISGVESEESVISHMQQHGVRFVQIYGVDNAIVRVPDPVMFGLFMQEGDDAGNKCVAKNGPHERVGVVCKKGGKYNVVEYSELSEEMANERDAEGNLVLSAGFICNLYYTVEFLVTKCSPETLPLLYHVARKAIPFYDEAANATVKPKEPNGVKMESFIFDVFPMSQKMGCLLVPRSEFTPVKNGNGRNEWDVGRRREIRLSGLGSKDYGRHIRSMAPGATLPASGNSGFPRFGGLRTCELRGRESGETGRADARDALLGVQKERGEREGAGRRCYGL